MTPAQQALLDKNIASPHGPLAAERIIQEFVDSAYERQQPSAPPLGDRVSGWLQTHTRTVIKKINMRRPGHRSNMRLHEHRFPPVTATELQQRIERLGALTGRFSRVRVEQTLQHMFRIAGPSVVGRHSAGRVGRSGV